ncbi:MAG TPA: 23S rRNA (guanosine(2251)-2'-O)-methyltransferase RlmB [Steroidobacteraceae bacterium]|nr:23S rRNA (guanosine(2251)-2'-O)-methyltransferase RlmB [Steroidobacteraceae bacterium]
MTQAVAYGVHAVRILLERSPQRVRRILLAQGKEAGRQAEIRALAQQAAVEVSNADEALLTKLSDGGVHQGVVAEVAPRPGDPETQLEEALEAAGESPLLLVLDGVQDPHNLGACLRSADAAGVCAVIAPRDRAAGLTPVARKVAAGAAEIVPFIPVVNLARTLRELKDRGVWMVGTSDTAAKSVYEARLTGPIGIVMGSEGDGMRRLTGETCDELVSIPMAGAVESLNVSVAAGIVLFEAVRQRRELAKRRPR